MLDYESGEVGKRRWRRELALSEARMGRDQQKVTGIKVLGSEKCQSGSYHMYE